MHSITIIFVYSNSVLSLQEFTFVIETLLLDLSIPLTPTVATTCSNYVQLYISLTLLVVTKIHLRSASVTNAVATDLLVTLQKFICNWISHPTIIGGSFFGGYPGCNYWKGPNELEVWYLILVTFIHHIFLVRFGLKSFKFSKHQAVLFLRSGNNCYLDQCINV